MFYIFTLREPTLVAEAKQLQKDFKLQQTGLYMAEKEEKKVRKSVISQAIKQWYDWFKEGQFYLYGMVYMVVRIAINVTMSVQPYYLIEVTGFEQTPENPTPIALALTPLVSYITSLIFSLFVYNRMMKRLKNRFYPLFISIIVIACGSTPFIFLTSDPSIRWLVYVFSSI